MTTAASSTRDLPSRIRRSLEDRGFHYEPRFGRADDGGLALINLARQLGSIFVPEGLNPDRPVLVTQPAPDAPRSQPFDRPEGIGWHNDFSTFVARPALTLIWIAQQDPGGERFGAWRVASTADVLRDLGSDPAGQSILHRLRTEEVAVGYEGSKDPQRFRLLEPVASSRCNQEVFRFYGRSLREGCRLIHGAVTPQVEEIITAVERAADAVGSTLPATDHALLVVDNRRSLHDRTAQSTGEAGALRRAILCFVHTQHLIL